MLGDPCIQANAGGCGGSPGVGVQQVPGAAAQGAADPTAGLKPGPPACQARAPHTSCSQPRLSFFLQRGGRVSPYHSANSCCERSPVCPCEKGQALGFAKAGNLSVTSLLGPGFQILGWGPGCQQDQAQTKMD